MREIEIREIHDKPADLYSPRDTFIGTIYSELQLHDVCLQIKKHKCNGYYLMFEQKRIEIFSNGKIIKPPKGFFDTINSQITKIVFDK
jgi:hypothetical protein